MNRRKFVTHSAVALGSVMAIPFTSLSKTNSENDVIQIGIIGVGKRGTGLINMIETVPGLKIVACCDILPDHLKTARAKVDSRAKAYTDYRELLSDGNVDAVVIATPLYLHHSMAVDALSAGKHVYVEKTMTFTIEQSLDLVRKVRDSKSIFQVGFQYRNFALYHKVKELVQAGWIGETYSFECQYNRNSNWRYPVSDPQLEKVINWRMYKEMSGGPLAELCSHQIDAVNYFTNSHPLKAMGIGGIDFWKDGRETHDNVRTIYTYANGVKATYTSVLSNAFNGYFIRILGNRATIEIGRDKAYLYAEAANRDLDLGTVDGVTGATLLNATQGEKTEIHYLEEGQNVVEPTISALSHFHDSIINNRQPVSNVETGSNAAIAICMGLNAMETGNTQYWRNEYTTH